MPSVFPSDAQRGTPAWLTKLGSTLFRARYRSSVGDSNAAAKTPVVIQGAASQTADLLDIYDSAKNLLFFVDKNGNMASGGAAGNGVTRGVVQTNLAAADLIAMGTTPIAVTPTPAAGTAVVVDQIVVVLNTTATQFTSGGVVHFYYHGQTTEIMSATIAAASVTTTAGQAIFILQPVATAGGSVVTKEVGIDITNATAAFATGTGTAKVYVSYRIVTL